jgi:hypothetical protein
MACNHDTLTVDLYAIVASKRDAIDESRQVELIPQGATRPGTFRLTGTGEHERLHLPFEYQSTCERAKISTSPAEPKVGLCNRIRAVQKHYERNRRIGVDFVRQENSSCMVLSRPKITFVVV